MNDEDSSVFGAESDSPASGGSAASLDMLKSRQSISRCCRELLHVQGLMKLPINFERRYWA